MCETIDALGLAGFHKAFNSIEAINQNQRAHILDVSHVCTLLSAVALTKACTSTFYPQCAVNQHWFAHLLKYESLRLSADALTGPANTLVASQSALKLCDSCGLSTILPDICTSN